MNSTTVSWKTIVLGMLAVLLAGVVWDSVSTRTELDRYIKQYTQYKINAEKTERLVEQLYDSVQKTDESLKEAEKKANQLSGEITQLKRQIPTLAAIGALRDSAERLRLTEDSVAMARTVIPLQDLIIEEQAAANREQERVIQNQDSLVQTWIAIAKTREERETILRFALDTCRRSLTGLPPIPSNPDRGWLGIKKPSRPIVFAAGIVTGVAGSVILYRELSR